MALVPVGPFVLSDVLGTGGMGQVWAGVHRRSGLPVAVKVVDATGEDADALRAFRREVEAVAGLDHPAIVMVYDHGVVDAEAEAASDGRLEAGTPWLAMEHAGGGPLGQQRPRSWQALHALLVTLLDGLAHAHARGVIHRDLKPANVLRCLRTDLRPGWKLADFGIAHVAGHNPDHTVAAGTPLYMAPEQAAGSWRDFGPWTDLYALGAVVWHLVSGAPPFRETSRLATALAHQRRPLPELSPRLSIPDEMERWLRWLLEKKPEARPANAAVALRSLAELDAVEGETALPPISDRPTLALDDQARTTRPSDPAAGGETTIVLPRGPEGRAGAFPVAERLPFPASWRRPPTPRPADTALQAGRGLFGVRDVRFVGRIPERDALWEALGHVLAHGGTRLVSLRGPAGIGKSRLARWLGERAAELGLAQAVRVPHAAVPSPGTGLPALAEHWLRVRGLPADEARRRVRSLGKEAAAWRALAAGEPVEDRVHVAVRLVRAMAARQPLVLWLDDAALDEDALRLARSLLRASTLVDGVLVVTTAEDGALAAAPDADRQLRQLEAHPRAVPRVLGALDDAASRSLALALGVDEVLAERLASEHGGNPLYLVRLVGELVRSGALEASGRGWMLRDGTSLQAPADVTEAWVRQLAPGLDALGAEVRDAAWLAAALGPRVEQGVWAALAPAAADAEDHLVRAGAMLRDDAGVVFTHAAARLAVVAHARDAGAWTEVNLRCARWYGTHRHAQGPAHLGAHLMAAGRWEDAVVPLELAARARGDRDHIACLAVAAQVERCVEEGVAPDHPSVLSTACWALASHGNLWHHQRVVDLGLPLLARLRRAGALEQVPRILHVLGNAALRLHRMEEARAWLTEALVTAAPGIERTGVLSGLGRVCQHERELDDAARYYEEAWAAAASLTPFMKASTTNDLGNVARLRGDLVEAEVRFREALAICEAHDLDDGLISRLNLAGVLMRTDREAEAHAVTLETLAQAERRVSPLAWAASHALVLETAALVGDWMTWDRYGARTASILASHQVVDISIADTLIGAGRAARRAGYDDRARQALSAACEQLEALGDARLVEVQDDLATLQA